MVGVSKPVLKYNPNQFDLRPNWFRAHPDRVRADMDPFRTDTDWSQHAFLA